MPGTAAQVHAPGFPSRSFRLFWAGETVSGFGTYVSALALQTVVVLTLDGGATEVGWLNSARWLPYLVLGLLVGAWVDRVPRRPVMAGTDLVRACLMASVPLAWWTGTLTLPLLLGIVLAFGVASVTNDAASQSFVTRLVPAAHLQPAHARLDASDAVAQSGGPALAGGLIQLLGAPVAVLVDAVSYLLSAVTVLLLRTDEPPRRPARTGPGLRAEIVEGVRWIYRGSGLRWLAVSTHVWFAGQAVLGVVLVPFALRTLEVSPLQLGLASAVGGLGALAGAVTSGRLGRRLGPGGAVALARVCAVAGAVTMAVAVLPGSHGAALALFALGQGVHGAGMGLSNSHEMTFRQQLTPDELQARTNTTMRSFNRAVVVVGAPLAGWLATAAGPVPALLVAAGIFGVSVVVLALSPLVRRSRIAPGAGPGGPGAVRGG